MSDIERLQRYCGLLNELLESGASITTPIQLPFEGDPVTIAEAMPVFHVENGQVATSFVGIGPYQLPQDIELRIRPPRKIEHG